MLVTVWGCWLKVRKTGPGIKKASSRVLRARDRVKGPRSTGKVEEVIERVVFGGIAQVPSGPEAPKAAETESVSLIHHRDQRSRTGRG
jgi:hypothetical protein